MVLADLITSAYKRLGVLDNKDRQLEYNRRWKESHPDRYQTTHNRYGRQWRINNPDKHKAIQARYRKTDKCKAAKARWDKNNHEKRKIMLKISDHKRRYPDLLPMTYEEVIAANTWDRCKICFICWDDELWNGRFKGGFRKVWEAYHRGWVHDHCNRAMGTLKPNEFHEWIRYISDTVNNKSYNG